MVFNLKKLKIFFQRLADPGEDWAEIRGFPGFRKGQGKAGIEMPSDEQVVAEHLVNGNPIAEYTIGAAQAEAKD